MKLVRVAVLGLGLSKAAQAACSKDGDDCSLTGCCEKEGSKCFRKNDHWSSCNATCEPKKVWKDGKWTKSDTKVWDCEAILPHQVAKAPECKDPKKNGEDCSETGCCAEKGARCFKKDDNHSSCNATCTPYAKWVKDKWVTTDEPTWDCTVVNPVLAKPDDLPSCASPAENGMDCSAFGCCVDPDSTCYRKNKHWSSCNATCKTNMKWDFEKNKWGAQKKQVWDCAVVYPPAVPKMDCDDGVEDGKNCTDSGCCKSAGSVCFKKNDHWASCMKRCWTNKVWDFDENKWTEKDHQVWDCGVIEPKAKATRLYEVSDKQADDQAAGRPLLTGLALGVLAGGSITVFRAFRRQPPSQVPVGLGAQE